MNLADHVMNGPAIPEEFRQAVDEALATLPEDIQEPVKNAFVLGFIQGYNNAAEDIRQEGDLNEILKECAKLRGVYRLQHRILKEFAWFVETINFEKWDDFGADYVEAVELKKYKDCPANFKDQDNTLLEWGKLFLEYYQELAEKGELSYV